MIKLENFEVVGWEHAIRGMRNPMNSWDRSDSEKICRTLKNEEVCPGVEALVSVPCEPYTSVGPNDHELMMKLAKGGPVHAKYRRMIVVYVDITAPLYWWKEFDTYKVGTVANSCSTMHKIHEKEFTLDDFSHEKLIITTIKPLFGKTTPELFCEIIDALNFWRNQYNETKEKLYLEQMIQLLPTSYNQRRTVMLNYEVLYNMYHSRKHHKLDEWRELCKWIEKLPYSEIITGEKEVVEG
jgi:hypothetical protein